MRENQFPALYADVEAEPLSWGDVLGAYDEEQAAQREYEALVWSAIATQVPLDWEVMNRSHAAQGRSRGVQARVSAVGTQQNAATEQNTFGQRRSP